MKKTTRRILIAAAALLFVLLALGAAFFVVFDVASWQRLDPDKLHALSQTSSVYAGDG